MHEYILKRINQLKSDGEKVLIISMYDFGFKYRKTLESTVAFFNAVESLKGDEYDVKLHKESCKACIVWGY